MSAARVAEPAGPSPRSYREADVHVWRVARVFQ
jgi:hypothetical protein